MRRGWVDTNMKTTMDWCVLPWSKIQGFFVVHPREELRLGKKNGNNVLVVPCFETQCRGPSPVPPHACSHTHTHTHMCTFQHTGMSKQSNSCYFLLQKRGFIMPLERFTKLCTLKKSMQRPCECSRMHGLTGLRYLGKELECCLVDHCGFWI
jgi:hypothetical protein